MTDRTRTEGAGAPLDTYAAFFDAYAANYTGAASNGAWCYEDGCVYRGLAELGAASANPVWRAHLERLVAERIGDDGVPAGYAVTDYNIDNILAGRVLFSMVRTPGDRYDKALDLLAEQLAGQPRTRAGSYWHKKIYPNQVWLDGLYMGLPFQIEYGLTRGRPELVTDAIAQMLRATDLMQDAGTGLYFHGYDDSRAESWADAETGLSASLWGRADGWLAMALIDCFALLPETHAARPELARRILMLAEAILAHRTPGGLWLQVLDRPDLAGNYEETSCASMFAYFLLKAARLLPDGARLGVAGEKALDALFERHVQKVGDVWQLDNVCAVAGLGNPFGKPRDGTPAYYLSEPVVANDPKGVGPLMMAVAERLRRAEP